MILLIYKSNPGLSIIIIIFIIIVIIIIITVINSLSLFIINVIIIIIIKGPALMTLKNYLICNSWLTSLIKFQKIWNAQNLPKFVDNCHFCSKKLAYILLHFYFVCTFAVLIYMYPFIFHIYMYSVSSGRSLNGINSHRYTVQA